MICSLSNLNEDHVRDIKNLESDLGVTVLAFSCHDTQPAVVNKETLDKIQALEAKLGISLVAVDA